MNYKWRFERLDMKQQASCTLQSILTPPNGAKIVFWTDTRLERPEATVTLFCRASGEPRPAIEWFEEDDAAEYQKVQNDNRHLVNYCENGPQ
jgi:hypothetical protein